LLYLFSKGKSGSVGELLMWREWAMLQLNAPLLM
jgi:hypothetical protein